MLAKDRQEQASILAVVIIAVVIMLALAVAYGGSCAACNAMDHPYDFV